MVDTRSCYAIAELYRGPKAVRPHEVFARALDVFMNRERGYLIRQCLISRDELVRRNRRSGHWKAVRDHLERMFDGRGITYDFPARDDDAKPNGFIEHFVDQARTAFKPGVKNWESMEQLQRAFAEWVRSYNRAPSDHTYPTYGRAHADIAETMSLNERPLKDVLNSLPEKERVFSVKQTGPPLTRKNKHAKSKKRR